MSPERIPWENIPQRPERNVPGVDVETSQRNERKVDVNRLINLTERHPVTKEPLEEHSKRIDDNCWGEESFGALTPRMVIDLIKEHGFDGAADAHPEYAHHIHKIKDADYSYPIHVHGDWVINGAHRLAKLVLKREIGETQQDFVTVKRLKKIPEEALVTTG